MTNTEGTLALKKVYTGPDAGDIALEAEGIRAITDLIYYNWQSTRTTEEEQQELYFALYGLKTLIETHTAHAQQVYEVHQFDE